MARDKNFIISGVKKYLGKDVFVYDEHGIGLGYFTYANTELVIHKISEDQCGDKTFEPLDPETYMVINYNGLFDKQRAVRLRNVDADGNYGLCVPITSGLFTPWNTKYCCVPWMFTQYKALEIDSTIEPSVIQEAYNQLIQHELSHAVGLEDLNETNVASAHPWTYQGIMGYIFKRDRL